jgi:hypothetical protein
MVEKYKLKKKILVKQNTPAYFEEDLRSKGKKGFKH